MSNLKKKIILCILLILIILFFSFLYNAKPVRDYKHTDYLVIAKNLTGNIYSNKYTVEQLPSRGKINQLESFVGYSDNSIFISAWYGSIKSFKRNKNYYIARYIVENGHLKIAEIIDLNISSSDNQSDYPEMLYIDSSNLYYFNYYYKELIKYNISTHKKEVLAKINACIELYEFNGKYICYATENNMVVSKIQNNREIKIGEFSSVSLIPRSDLLLIHEDGIGNAYYNIKTKKKTYIKNSDIEFWQKVVDSGKRVAYVQFHTNPLRMFFTGGELWYYDFWLFDLETGKRERIFQLFGTYVDYIVINLNEYPNFRIKDVEKAVH